VELCCSKHYQNKVSFFILILLIFTKSIFYSKHAVIYHFFKKEIQDKSHDEIHDKILKRYFTIKKSTKVGMLGIHLHFP